MTTRVRVDLMTVGSCRHSERVTLAGGRLRAATFPSLSALLRHPTRGPVLYDTGYAAHFRAATQRFPERLYRWVTPVALPPEQELKTQLLERGVALTDVGTCLISHFHADHIAGLRDLPNARFVATAADHAALCRASRVGGLRKGLLPALLPPDFAARLTLADEARPVALGPAWRAFGAGMDLFGDGSVLGIALPGHTPRQMGLLLRDEDDREVLLCADACWSRAAWRELRFPSWLARSLLHDWLAYRATLQALHVLGTKHEEVVLVPSHCQQSIADYARAQRRAAAAVAEAAASEP